MHVSIDDINAENSLNLKEKFKFLTLVKVHKFELEITESTDYLSNYQKKNIAFYT